MAKADGKDAKKVELGYLAVPKQGSGPGVLVLHAWWGLNEFFKSLADRLAEAGFVAFAPDLYHGKTASTIQEAEALLKTLSQPRAQEDIVNGVRTLRSHPSVRGKGFGAIGFSMGASWALWIAEERPEDIAAVVLFYGTGEAKRERSHAAYLGHFAEKDEWEDAAYIKEMERVLKTGGKDVTFHTYPGTGHWFFEQNRPDVYKAEASGIAWHRTLDFLRAHLSPRGT